MTSLVQADKKAVAIQITPFYNCGVQKIISEYTKHSNLSLMSYSRNQIVGDVFTIFNWWPDDLVIL